MQATTCPCHRTLTAGMGPLVVGIRFVAAVARPLHERHLTAIRSSESGNSGYRNFEPALTLRVRHDSTRSGGQTTVESLPTLDYVCLYAFVRQRKRAST
jgi:hypothetical protein